MDYTNKALGLRVQTQIPLNVKEYALSEADLADLGVNNNLAYIYEKGLIVYCIEEGTRWEWKEITPDEIGLLDDNFIYPNNIITFGIDYSNKEYNFVQYGTVPTPSLQDFQSVLTVGNITDLTAVFNGYGTSSYLHTEVSGGRIYMTDDNNSSASLFDNGGFGAFDPENDKKTSLSPSGIHFKDISILEINSASNGIGASSIFLPITTGFGNDRTLLAEGDVRINDSATITKTGSGTILDPFILTALPAAVIPNQKIITYPTDFTGTNYTLLASDHNKLIIIKNGATNVTITVPTGLAVEHFSAFIRQGTGEVAFTASGTTINSFDGLRINGTFQQVALDREASTTTFYLNGNTKV